MPSIAHLLFQHCGIVLAGERCNRSRLCASVDPDLIGGNAQSDEKQNARGVEHPEVTPGCLTDRARDQICRGIMALSSSSIPPRFFFQRQSLEEDGFCLFL